MIRPPLTDRVIEALAEGYPPGSPTLPGLDWDEALTSMAQEIRALRARMRAKQEVG